MESYNPYRPKTWTPNTGRVTSGKTVGSVGYYKYKVPYACHCMSEAEYNTLTNLCESKPDFGALKFYKGGSYIEIKAYASDVEYGYILDLGNEVYYMDVKVSFVEQ